MVCVCVGGGVLCVCVCVCGGGGVLCVVCVGGFCLCVCFLVQLMNLYYLFLFPAKLTVLSQKLFFAAPEEIKEE